MPDRSCIYPPAVEFGFLVLGSNPDSWRITALIILGGIPYISEAALIYVSSADAPSGTGGASAAVEIAESAMDVLDALPPVDAADPEGKLLKAEGGRTRPFMPRREMKRSHP